MAGVFAYYTAHDKLANMGTESPFLRVHFANLTIEDFRSTRW